MMKNKKPSGRAIQGALELLSGVAQSQSQPTPEIPQTPISDAQRAAELVASEQSTTARLSRHMQHAEYELQCRCVAWFRAQFPDYPTALFHVENEGWRTYRQSQRWHASGGVAGVPDLFLLAPSGRLVMIELKTERGRVSASQRQFMTEATASGHECHVVRSLEDFQALALGVMGKGSLPDLASQENQSIR